MKVRDQTPSGEPIRLLHEIDEVSSEIKADQTFGSSSVFTGRVFSPDTYDILIPAAETRDVMIEFVPSDLTFGGALVYQLVAVEVHTSFLTVVNVERQRVIDNRQRWIYYRTAGSDVKLKFYFFAAGSGTFSANLI